MNVWALIGLVLSLAGLFSYLNHRYIRLPTTIGVMLVALVVSLLVIASEAAGWHLREEAQAMLSRVRFESTVMLGLVGFLLFAGALHVELNELSARKLEVLALATLGVVTSTFLTGGLTYGLSLLMGAGLDWIHALLFGALISPTDPIAVLGILKSAKVPKSVEVTVAGESMFNDGIGVVVFVTLLDVARGDAPSVHGVVEVFAKEALGGAALGLALGWITYRLLMTVDDDKVEILLTIALVGGGSALANGLGTSGLIAMAVAGLVIGNQGRRFAMSDRTREHLDTFWEVVDEVLNVILFVLIGLELLLVPFSVSSVTIALAVIPLTLLARWGSVVAVRYLLRLLRPPQLPRDAARLLTWAGVRGGISIALALSLPDDAVRPLLIAITYAVVVFSLLVQATTLGPFLRARR